MPTNKNLSARLLTVADNLSTIFCALKAFTHALRSVYSDGVDEETASGFDWLGDCVLQQVEQLTAQVQQLEGSQVSFECALRETLTADQVDEVLQEFITWTQRLERKDKDFKGVVA